MAIPATQSMQPAVMHEYVVGQEYELAPTELPHVHVWDSKAAGVPTLVIREERMYVAEAHTCAICGMMTSDNGRTWGRPHLAAIPAIIPSSPKATVTTARSAHADEPTPAAKGFGMRLLLNAITGVAVATYALWIGLALIMAIGLMTGTLVVPGAWFQIKPWTIRQVKAANKLLTIGYRLACVWWRLNKPIMLRHMAHRWALFVFFAVTFVLASF